MQYLIFFLEMIALYIWEHHDEVMAEYEEVLGEISVE